MSQPLPPCQHPSIRGSPVGRRAGRRGRTARHPRPDRQTRQAGRFAEGGGGAIFRAWGERLTGWTLTRRVVLAMIKRRAAAAGLPPSTCCHTFRATGITADLAQPWGMVVGFAAAVDVHHREQKSKRGATTRPARACFPSPRRRPARVRLVQRTPVRRRRGRQTSVGDLLAWAAAGMIRAPGAAAVGGLRPGPQNNAC